MTPSPAAPPPGTVSVPAQRDGPRSAPAHPGVPGPQAPAVPAAGRRAAALLSRLRTEQDDPWPVYEQLRALGGVVNSPWGPLVATRRRRVGRGDDAPSRWLAAWDRHNRHGDAVDVMVRRLAAITTTASIETTTTALNTAVYLLGQHPDQAAWLAEHPDAIPAAVNEILRYDPPIHVVCRVAAQTTDLDGTRVPRGAMVYALIAAAERDPERLPDAARFDVRRRQPGPHLAFGAGPHYCLGAGLVRQLILTRQRIDAATALRIGLAHHTAPPADLEATTTRLAKTILRGDDWATRLSLELIEQPADSGVDAALMALAHLRASRHNPTPPGSACPGRRDATGERR